MTGHYILIGQTPVPCADLLEWARWFDTADRRVALTRLPWGAWVSTVFLGLDHGFGGEQPILYESMVFWPDGDAYEQTRCATWSEAERMHEIMVAVAVRPGAVCAWVRRAWNRACWDAGLDALRLWKELRHARTSH